MKLPGPKKEQLMSADEAQAFSHDLERAVAVGTKRGLEGVADGALIDRSKLEMYAGKFRAYKPIENHTFKSVILISRDFPPNHGGGIGTFNKDLAEALACDGNIVHVITQSPDINRVYFENGVWVHRMVTPVIERSPEALSREIPQNIWSWSATALEEARRIATHRVIDVIEAPIWECQGAAFLLDGEWPLVTSLQTTLHFWLESHPELIDDQSWFDSYGKQMLALEQEIMANSNGVRSISRAIANVIERAYGFAFDKERIRVAPLGMAARAPRRPSARKKHLDVLFVGRLEYRKGIDVLLRSIPLILEQAPETQFRIIGDCSIKGPDGRTFRDIFLADSSNQLWVGNVHFEGRVGEEELLRAYASCDIFVAPSRFESFGLVFLEAMREGKPVIGCVAGGMPEVVAHGINGLLVEPGNVEELARAILSLINDQALRAGMGKTGKTIFEEKFTSSLMAKASIDLYRLAQRNFGESIA